MVNNSDSYPDAKEKIIEVIDQIIHIDSDTGNTLKKNSKEDLKTYNNSSSLDDLIEKHNVPCTFYFQ